MSLFLLSPASLHGRRGRRLLDPAAADHGWGRRLRAGVPLGDLYSHVSALYFRGKLTYALRFANAGGTRIIAPGFGLAKPEWRVDPVAARRLAEVRVDAAEAAYRRPLERALRRLRERPGDGPYVFLGSVATDRYLAVLAPILGAELAVPAAFFGLGSMQRGSLLLRAAAAGRELEYVAWQESERVGASGGSRFGPRAGATHPGR
ncbi:MAG TPA: hypothetical protein VMV46_21190 [Thermoanaerobaculia bacterium]|nr:hypothetical protein [Thermoanaerobaculia bacterium]